VTPGAAEASTTVVVVLASAAPLAAGAAAAVGAAAWSGAPVRRAVGDAAVVLLLAATTCAAVLLIARPPLAPALVPATASLAALAAVLLDLAVRAAGIRPPLRLVLLAVWTATVSAPVAVALLADDGVLGAAGLRTLDLGGALPAVVAPGAAAAALVVIARPRARAASAPARPGVVLGAALAGWAWWVGWLVGLELAIDDLTPRIVSNAVLVPAVAIGMWLLVQRLRHARTDAAAAGGGLLAGLAAVTAGCAYLDPLGAVLTGVIAGGASASVASAATARSGRAAWAPVCALLVAGGAGVVLLGIFATRTGLMFTGQPEVLFAQTASAAGAAALGAGTAAVLVLVLGALRRLRRSSSVRG